MGVRREIESKVGKNIIQKYERNWKRIDRVDVRREWKWRRSEWNCKKIDRRN